MQKISSALTLAVFLLAGLSFPAKAQQSRGGVSLTSVGHAVSQPLTSYQGTTHPKGNGALRLIPLRRPEMAAKGGPGGSPPSGGGNWSDADLQSSYGNSQFSIGKVFQAYTFSGYLPPDENLSVGINSTGTNPQTQILSVVNTSYRVFDTSGNLLVQGDLATGLFGTFTSSVCSTEDGGDPIGLYDKIDHRWIISQLAYNSTFTDNHLCLAISQTSNATGSYDLYDIPFGSNLPDYPKLAVWSDGIYFSANIFASSGSASTLQFTGAQACSFPRSDVTGSPANITFTCSPGTDTAVYNILPADLEGTTPPPSGTGPDYYLQFSDNLTATSGNLLRLYQLNGHSLNVVANLTVNDFHEACGGGTCIPQSGISQLLDSLGDRLMYRLSYRNYGAYQQFVVNHSVQVSSGSQQTGIRWYAIRNSSGSVPFAIYKESTFSPDSTYYRWMGSIAQNKNGDLGLGYSTSGVTSVPGIAVTGLLNGADTGMELEQRLYNGSNQSYQGTYSRWGDYSSVSVDPTDDCTFWYTNEYVTPPVLSFNFLWQTVIGEFSFPDCSGSGTSPGFTLSPSPSTQSISPGATATYTITVASQNNYAGTVDLNFSGCPAGANCSLPTSVNVTANGTQTATLSISNTGGLAPANYTVNITGTDSVTSSLTAATSVALTVNPPPTFSLSTSGSPQSVTQGGTASFGISVSALYGFNSDVTLTVTSGCPSSPTGACSFSPSTITGGNGNATLNVATDATTTAQTYTINISASGGGVTQTASVSLTVNSAATSGNFSLSASPGSVSLRGNSTAVYTVTVAPSGGFNGPVQLYISGLPNGASGGFSPNPATSTTNWSSTLSVNTNNVKKGSYTLTITGISGSLASSTTVSLKQH
ncbi:MAG TPA: hypothetical protein VMW54_10730 [Terriglobia bacterium]|nr:hypothetical protein [Terriglobia bacterium]